MVTRHIELFTVEDLKNNAGASGNWFNEQSERGLAGRCLLDAIEYLRTQPKFASQFLQVANAHAVRLTTICLAPGGLNLPDYLKQLKVWGTSECQKLLKSRLSAIPYYGDDFWDWAAILECFLEVRSQLPNDSITESQLNYEITQFKDAVEQTLKTDGLYTGGEEEWYGPATATIAYRILRRWERVKDLQLGSLLRQLKKQALEPIDSKGNYLDIHVPEHHVIWHLSQVVTEFPREAKNQWKMVKSLIPTMGTYDQTYRAYALARVVQGAIAIKDEPTRKTAIKKLYQLEAKDRPFGEGLVSEKVKASLNVLEALWRSLPAGDKSKIAEMVEALREVVAKANIGMIFVAIPNEADAVKNAFEKRGATIEILETAGNQGVDQTEKFTIRHSTYRIVVGKGKSIMNVTEVMSKMLAEHRPKWVLMIGVAGSLGTKKPIKSGKKKQFVGPKIGDIVLAASLAPFRIRDKKRGGGIENAAVQFAGSDWKVVPVHPDIFMQAHRCASLLYPEKENVKVWEGQIVTGTGILDDPIEKAAVLKEFPGGLAIEEEGYPVALVSMCKSTPFLIIRGISDLAEGDKIRMQQLKFPKDKENQRYAAANAARLAVAIVEELSIR